MTTTHRRMRALHVVVRGVVMGMREDVSGVGGLGRFTPSTATARSAICKALQPIPLKVPSRRADRGV